MQQRDATFELNSFHRCLAVSTDNPIINLFLYAFNHSLLDKYTIIAENLSSAKVKTAMPTEASVPF
jgi:hypothetical protein